MAKNSKLVYIIGSVAIGIVALLIIMGTLIFTGVINITQTKIAIQSGSAEFVFDGNSHTVDSWEITDGELKEGHTAHVVVSGSQTDVGSSQNYFSVTIIDENNADVTEYYDIENQPGTISVVAKSLQISSSSLTKVYNGIPLKCEEYKITNGELPSGYTVKANFSASITNVGIADNEFVVSIFDANGKDKTSSFLVNYLFGRLEVTSRAIVVSSSDNVKDYDGKQLVNDSAQIVDGALANGHSLIATFGEGITNVGSKKDIFVASIKDANGVDVTENYAIQYIYGTLTVNPRPFSIITTDAEKVYDGLALISEEYTIEVGSVVDGHTLNIQTIGSQTNAGKSKNAVALDILDKNGQTVKSNYSVTITEGTLTVTPLPISVSSGSSEKVYDGVLLTNETYTVDTGSVIDGHTMTIKAIGAQMYAGKSANTLSIEVVDENGVSVTGNYNFIKNEGVLNVHPRQLTVRSGDSSKDYDGTPLTCDDWSITSDSQPVDSHTVIVAVSGTRTEVGDALNTIAEVKVVDANGEDVTFNYNVTTEMGLLMVKGNNNSSGGSDDLGGSGGAGGTGGSGGAGGSGAGGAGGSGGAGGAGGSGAGGAPGSGSISGGLGGGADGEGANQVQVKIQSELSETVYLRYRSYGDYTGKGWIEENVDEYKFKLDGKYSPNYLTSYALLANGFTKNLINIEILSGSYYMLPYYSLPNDLHIQQSDVICTGAVAGVYSLDYLSYDYNATDSVEIDSNYSAFEKAYYEWVCSKYLSIPSSTAQYLQAIIDIKGWDKSDADIVSKVASYVQNAASYSLKYDRALDECDDIVVAFLETYKSGICQHYASAGTLLFRQLGIPARYTGGYVGDAEAGEWVEITGSQAHAWVEIYIQGLGWIKVEVTGGGPGGGAGGSGGSGNGSGGAGGSGGSGSEGEEAGKFQIKPYTVYCKYDGHEHSYSCRNPKTLQGLTKLPKGYTYTFKVEGARTELGITETTITEFVLYDEDGNDVTSEFELTFNTGKLQVYEYEITVQTYSATKVYDGLPLSSTAYRIADSTLPSNYLVKVEVNSSIVGVGTKVNRCTVVILDGNGNDVTDECKVITICGNLTIKPIEIVITADSAIKVKDGQPLTANGYTVSGVLATGDVIESVVITGSQVYTGHSSNVVGDVVIKNGEKDVTANYKIIKVNGTLTVTRS